MGIAGMKIGSSGMGVGMLVLICVIVDRGFA